MHVAALGVGIVSVHSLALHVVPPVAHTQAFPAPSVVALQAAKDVKEYVAQAAAGAQAVPLKAQVDR